MTVLYWLLGSDPSIRRHATRDGAGRWALGTRYTGAMPGELGAAEGRPSRWNTRRALPVLRSYERADA